MHHDKNRRARCAPLFERSRELDGRLYWAATFRGLAPLGAHLPIGPATGSVDPASQGLLAIEKPETSKTSSAPPVLHISKP